MPSKIQGSGLFTSEYIKRGDVIMLWNANAHVILENEYDQRTAENDEDIIKSGVRYIKNYFLYTDKTDRIENYINHSFMPNVLYHCGICFAIRDININEELTVDYTYLLSEKDPPVKDYVSGKIVCGISGYECLKQTTNQLADILNNKTDS